jgi:hypothetical protein
LSLEYFEVNLTNFNDSNARRLQKVPAFHGVEGL